MSLKGRSLIKARGLIVAIGLSTCGLLAYALTEARSSPPAAPATTMTPVAADKLAAEPARRPAPTAAHQAAPPSRAVEPQRTDKPVSRSGMTLLKARADAGDSRAACQLSSRLLLCGDTLSLRTMLANVGSLPAREQAAAQDVLNRARDLLSVCEGAPADAWRQGVRYMRQAALAGEPEAMFRYARGDATLVDFSHMGSPEFELWRKEAVDFMQLAFEAGYAPAITELNEGYQNNGTPLAGLILNDPVRARASALLLNQLRGATSMVFSLGNVQQDRQSELLAGEWRRRYFDGTKLPRDGTVWLAPINIGASVFQFAPQEAVPSVCSP